MLTKLKTAIITRLISPVVARLPANVLNDVMSRGSVIKKTGQRRLGRVSLAEFYIRGEGIEVGAFNSPLPVPEGVKVRYVDIAPAETLVGHAHGLDFVTPDIVDDAQTLATLPDESQDFVIACHIIEHTEDPIGAVGNWLRVLKPGGTLFIAIPDKRFTFDVERDATPLEHLLRDHEEGPAWSRKGHYEEVARLVMGVSDERKVKEFAEQNMEQVGHTHFHVWTQADMFEMIAALRKRAGLEFDVLASAAAGNETVFVLMKGDAGRDRAQADESLRSARGQVK
ncbi:MAG TPA: methyltransferase domain-containing protein [Pyrinomonadaceae bacterium]|nr:methyltransferase domain-containing protein [Pyrinomonadaceae bacterium]